MPVQMKLAMNANCGTHVAGHSLFAIDPATAKNPGFASRADGGNINAMCGRFYLPSHVVDEMQRINPQLFAGLEQQVIERVTGGDIRPTNQILTIVGEPTWKVMRWVWKRDFNAAVINARTDKLKSRFWNKALRERRCVIPAGGFFEWVEVPDYHKKQPKAIQWTQAQPMVFGGIWEEHKELGLCATIVTTDAPPNVRPTHDRCPLILEKEGMEKWLASDTTEEEALALCVPYMGDMAIWECDSPSKDTVPTPARRTEGRREQREMF